MALIRTGMRACGFDFSTHSQKQVPATLQIIHFLPEARSTMKRPSPSGRMMLTQLVCSTSDFGHMQFNASLIGALNSTVRPKLPTRYTTAAAKIGRRSGPSRPVAARPALSRYTTALP